MSAHLHDAYVRLGAPSRGGILFTCEHASNRVPAPFRPRPADRRLLAMHWGYDIGAATVTAELTRLFGGGAVLARFSRLLIDPNRAPDDPTAVLRTCDDGSPTFNRTVDLAARVSRFHVPFHAAIEAHLTRARPRFLCSIHSFTPVFRDTVRPMEAGVLFDRHDDLAEGMVRALRDRGLRTEANEPYSGKAGLIYSAARHGVGLPYLELELRQDLIADDRSARRVARTVAAALRAIGV
jgi:predicted N-formylglutamate amidohydrolase